MLGLSSGGVDDTSVKAVITLLDLLADTKKTKEMLTQLQQALIEANQAIGKAEIAVKASLEVEARATAKSAQIAAADRVVSDKMDALKLKEGELKKEEERISVLEATLLKKNEEVERVLAEKEAAAATKFVKEKVEISEGKSAVEEGKAANYKREKSLLEAEEKLKQEQDTLAARKRAIEIALG